LAWPPCQNTIFNNLDRDEKPIWQGAPAAGHRLSGLWLVARHWVFDTHKRKRARYALTIKRANQIRLISSKVGTVHFAKKTYHTKNGPQVKNVGFRFIHDGRAVYDLLRKVREDNK